MKIVIAPDSFKESLKAADVADAIESGFRQVMPDAEYVKVPVADGGEGTLELLLEATGGRRVQQDVSDPLGRCQHASFCILGDDKTAVIEMAQASGLSLLSLVERNPQITTTFGTGELIRAALDRGVERILVGLGGSATNDGGAGMMQALGVRFLDSAGSELPAGGAALSRLSAIDTRDMDPRLSSVEFIVACDVKAPLTGVEGAAQLFGPQKGASPAEVEQLDQALHHYAAVIKQVLGCDIANVAGAGAAGGMGAALIAFMGAELKSGVELVIDFVRLEEHCHSADLVITGEGKIDGQTASGKASVGVAGLAKKRQLPVVALCGCVGANMEAVYRWGIDVVFPIIDSPVSLDKALNSTPQNLERTARNVAALLQFSLEGK